MNEEMTIINDLKTKTFKVYLGEKWIALFESFIEAKVFVEQQLTYMAEYEAEQEARYTGN